MKFLLFGFVFLSVLVLPEVASAQLVTCQGLDCNACSFVDMVNRIVKLIIALFAVIAALLLAWSGVGLITSGGDQSAMEKFKSTFVNVVIGLILVLASWMIISVILETLTGKGLNMWGVVSCGGIVPSGMTAHWPGSPEEQDAARADIGEVFETLEGCGGDDCVALKAPCKDSSKCNVSPAIASKIDAMHASVAASGITGARVTEAWPPVGYSAADPTGIHVSKCHGNGTCVDYGKAGGFTATEINTVAKAAFQAGSRPVYEVKTQGEKDNLVKAGATASVIKVIPQITAPHFSIYGQ